MKILLAVGGSGGHLFPAQQLASLVREKDAAVFFAGHLLEKSLFFQKEEFPFTSIPSAPLSKKFSGIGRFLKEMVKGVLLSAKVIRKFQPDVVVGFGSFHSFPVLLAAVFLRKKIVLFEANCLLGKVNRFFVPFATYVCVQFAMSSTSSKLQLVSLLPWERKKTSWTQSEARKSLGLSPCLRTLLIMGGSQGASFINQEVPKAISSHLQVIHLVGRNGDCKKVQDAYLQAGVRAYVSSFEGDMNRCYMATDLAICRSGASTLCELIDHQIPALLIPFPASSEGHQRLNAEFMVEKVRGALLLSEKMATRVKIFEKYQELIDNHGFFKKALLEFGLRCKERKDFHDIIVSFYRAGRNRDECSCESSSAKE